MYLLIILRSLYNSGMGHIYIKAHDKVGDIIPDLIERAQLPKDASVILYEVSLINRYIDFKRI